jgi:hypothetical protein
MEVAAVSTTVMVELALPVLTASSVAVKVTVVTPRAQKAGALLTRVGVRSTLSTALALASQAWTNGLLMGVPPVVVHSTVRPTGAVTTGGVVSTTGQPPTGKREMSKPVTAGGIVTEGLVAVTKPVCTALTR